MSTISDTPHGQFNYGFSHVDGGPSPGNLNIFQARVQFVY
jgi:hypothetical protein